VLRACCLFAALFVAAPVIAQAPEVSPVPALESRSVDELWDAYASASDATGRKAAFEKLLKLRAERNIRNLEGVASALVARGREQLSQGETADAETEFRYATALAPDLFSAQLGLASARGLNLSTVAKSASTWQGRARLLSVGVGSVVLGLLVALCVFGAVLLLRYAPLLSHDLQENAPATVGGLAPGPLFLLLLLPLVLFLGWGWLPLWWMGLLFAYMNLGERITVVAGLVLFASIGPLVGVLAERQEPEQNPLFWTGQRTHDGSSDERDGVRLEQSRVAFPEDRDVAYLLALHYRKAGRERAAEGLYDDLLEASPDDPIALNNLANIEFAKGDVGAAAVRYEKVGRSAASPRVRATALYNLSIAKGFQFDYNAAAARRDEADSLSSHVTAGYKALWSYPAEGATLSTVVDIGPTAEDLWAKMAGTDEGVGRENIIGGTSAGPVGFSALSVGIRLAVFATLVGGIALTVSLWRGKSLLTVRCQKCGTCFSRRGRGGAAAAGLCTQCFHLFVVKDGISGPARKQKVREVSAEEARRAWRFRLLSLISPGAGHVFVEAAPAGLLILVVWYVLLAFVLLQLGPLPVVEESLGWRAIVPALVALGLIYILANALRPRIQKRLPSTHGARRVQGER
jgi:tetratricopeptide (TPR) repeat protein